MDVFRRAFEVQYTYSNALDQQRARALLIVSVALGAVALIAGVPIGIASADSGVLGTVAGLLVVSVAAYVLLQTGLVRAAGGLFVAALIAASVFPDIEGGVSEPTVIMFALPIVAAALLMGGGWTWAASGLAGAAFAFMAWVQIAQLGGVGTEEGEHLLVLSISAEAMLAILTAISWGLTRALSQWASNAQRRADQLSATLTIGRVAATGYDLNRMLARVAEATRAQFDIHHVHIYLYDIEKDQLTLAAGSGEDGQALHATGYTIQPGQGVVGRVYRTGEPFLAEDVTRSPGWAPNPMLPNARSELTVPILSPIGVVGVLDLQSDTVGELKALDIPMASGLADQLGLALQNLRLLARTREQAQFTQTLLNNLAEGIVAFDLSYHIIEANPAFGRMVGYLKEDLIGKDFREFVSPGDRVIQDNALARLRTQKTLAPIEMHYLGSPGASIPVRVNMALLRDLQDTHVGYILSVQDIAEELTTRVRQEVASETGRRLTSVLDIETLLHDLVTVAQERLGYYHVRVYLFEGDNILKMAEGAGEAGRQMKAAGESVPVNAKMSLVARAARERKPVVANDAQNDPDFLPNPLLPETLSEAAIPLIVGARVVGVLDINDNRLGRFSEGEILTLEGLANQLGIAIQNADLFATTQRALAETSLLLMSVRRMLDAEDEAGVYSVLLDTLNVGEPISRILIGAADPEPYYPPEAIRVVGAFGWDKRVARAGRRMSLDDWPLAGRIGGSSEPLVYRRSIAESRQRMSASDLDYLDKHDINTALLIPLVRGKRFFGLALIESCGAQMLLDDQANVCRSLCEQIAIVLENYHLLRETRDAQARYYDLYHSAPAGYQLLDSTGLLIDANQTMLDWLGYDREDIVGIKYFWELMPPDSQLVFREAFHRILEEGQQEDVEIELLCGDGSILPARGTYTAERGDDEGVVAVRGVFLDISKERAHDLRAQLAYQLGQEISRVLDTEKLLQEVVGQLALTFGYYYAHVYLFDDNRRMLTAMAGAGAAGAQMEAEGRSIPLSAEASPPAMAGRTLETVVLNDVTEEPGYLPAPRLPNTRTEIAIPLHIGERLLGILDIQHDKPGYFASPDEIRMLESLATQVAVALDNARLFDQVQDSMERTSALLLASQRMLAAAGLGEVYEALLAIISPNEAVDRVAILQAGPEFTPSAAYIELAALWSRTEPLEQQHSEIGTRYSREHAALEAGSARPAIYDVPGDDRLEKELREAAEAMGMRTVMKLTATHGDSWFGEVMIESHREHAFSSADLQLYTAMVDQAAVALQNLALLEQTEQALERERIAHQLAQRLTMLLEPERLLQEIVDQLAETFQYYHAHIYTLEEDGETLKVVAGLGQAGQIMKAAGHSIPIFASVSLVAEAARRLAPVVVEDVTASPSHLPNPFLPDTRSEAAIPLHIGERLLGVLDVQHSKESHFTDSEVRTLQIIANQAAIALSNAALYEEQLQITERLREVDILKGEFLATMSHELRTPLNSIIGYSELLIDEVGPQLDEMSREDLEAIHSSSHHLLAIINDILDLAKIEAGRLALDQADINLAEFLPEIIEMSRVLVGDRAVALRLDVPEDLPPVKADQTRLRQVIWNLLSNAIKFTEAGEVVVGCRADRHWMHFYVRDTGVGIAPEHQAIIFDRFRQVDGSLTRKKGGTGLGLAITRHLVEMHGGKIWIESELGKGATFYVDLPLEPPHEHDATGRSDGWEAAEAAEKARTTEDEQK